MLKRFNAGPELFNKTPSLIYQVALKAQKGKRCAIIFIDQGMAINVVVRMVAHTLLSQQFGATYM